MSAIAVLQERIPDGLAQIRRQAAIDDPRSMEISRLTSGDFRTAMHRPTRMWAEWAERPRPRLIGEGRPCSPTVCRAEDRP